MENIIILGHDLVKLPESNEKYQEAYNYLSNRAKQKHIIYECKVCCNIIYYYIREKLYWVKTDPNIIGVKWDVLKLTCNEMVIKDIID